MQSSFPLHTSHKDKHTMGHKRNRSFFTPSQIKQMEDTFSTFPFPDRDQIKKMSKTLDISERSLQVWFQNRRARQRKANSSNKKVSPKYHISPDTSPEPIKASPQANTPFPLLSTTKTAKTYKDKTINRPLLISPESSKQDGPSCHRIENKSNTSDTVTPIRIENCHVAWAPKSPSKESIPSIKDNRKYPLDKADDYQQMWNLYQRNPGTVLEYTPSNKTPSPKSKAKEAEELSPLNLCIRDSSRHVTVKPKTVTPMCLFPNYSTMYGYPPPLPCYPPFGFSAFYQPHHPFFSTANGKLDGHMPLYTFPFSGEMTVSDELKFRETLNH